MKFSRLFVMFLLTLILTSASFTAYASDDENDISSSSLDFNSSKPVKFNQVSNNAITSKDVTIDSLLKHANQDYFNKVTTPQEITDPYEPNNTIETASPITYDQNLSANIGAADDVDWYQVDLTAGTDVAFLLKNIPNGTDYDLYAFDPELNYAASENVGNTDEKLYLDIQTSGTWYIAVIPYSGYSSEDNYDLFVGDAWVHDSLTVETDMDFNYTQSNVGTVLPYQVLDLIDEPNVPDTARVTGIQFFTVSSLGNWGNQTDMIYSPQSSVWYQTNPGLNVILGLPQDNNELLFLKQQWAITSSIEVLFQPTGYYRPGVTFNYKYFIE